MFALVCLVALLSASGALASSGHRGEQQCHTNGNPYDALEGDMVIDGSLCVNDLYVNGKRVTASIENPCFELVSDNAGHTHLVRKPNCCVTAADCGVAALGHYLSCEYGKCRLHDMFSVTGKRACQNDDSCKTFAGPCQTYHCNKVGAGGLGTDSSDSSSSSESTSSSSSATSIESDNAQFIGNQPAGDGYCVFEDARSEECCLTSADCPYHELTYDPRAGKWIQQVCDSSHTCFEIKFPPTCCNQTTTCERDSDCRTLLNTYQNKPIGSTTNSTHVSLGDCIQEKCTQGKCVEDTTIARQVLCYVDVDNDGYPGIWDGKKNCGLRAYCNGCPSGWKQNNTEHHPKSTVCDCDDQDRTTNPETATYSICPSVDGSFDGDCDNYTCPWERDSLTCTLGSDGHCHKANDGYVVYESYHHFVAEFLSTLDNIGGGLTTDCNGNQVGQFSNSRVCIPGVNIGFLYNTSGFQADCGLRSTSSSSSSSSSSSVAEGGLPKGSPSRVFVNLISETASVSSSSSRSTSSSSSASTTSDSDNFDFGAYSELQDAFCDVLSNCLAYGDCESAYFEVIVEQVPAGAVVGPHCMVNTTKEAGNVYVPAGYCAEWGTSCADSFPSKTAPLRVRSQGDNPCRASVGPDSRVIVPQQAI